MTRSSHVARQIGRAATGAPPQGWEAVAPGEPLHSLLVPVDLSPASDRLLGRTVLLPLAGDAVITLLHVVPGSLLGGSRRGAVRDAREAMGAEATAMSRTLPRSAKVRPIVRVGVPAAEIAAMAAASAAELIVMGRGDGRPLRDAFLGSTAERVIRRGPTPVLVVRSPPHAPYRQPAIALDLDPAATVVLGALLRVAPLPVPPVTVIHGHEGALKSTRYPSVYAGTTPHERDRQRALRRELAEFLAEALAKAGIPPETAPAWRMRVRIGEARALIESTVARERTDLLALGTHGFTGMRQVFIGTVAGDVLRRVRCDVLVVPPREDAPRPSAARGRGHQPGTSLK